MSNSSETCSVCLSSNAILIEVSAADGNQVKLSSKLNLCVPAVDWSGKCCICPKCIEQLEIAYIFCQLCLQSYEVRRQQTLLVIKTEEPPLESNEISEFQMKSCLNEDEIPTSSLMSIDEADGLTSVDDVVQRLNRCVENCMEEIPSIENMPVDDIEEKYNDLNNVFLKTEESCDIEEANTKKGESKTRKPSKYPKKCDYCTKYFNRKQHLDTHVRRYHTLEKPYACDQCQERFTTSHNLKVHKNKHTNIRRYICSFCGKTFGTSTCLYHHTKIHLNKRQYKCSVCEKCFNTSSILRAHKICVHMDPKLWKYPCTFCEKRFPMKSGLAAHVRRHTGEKNFVCHICGKRFSDKDVVLKHFRSHTNERLFKCHLCVKEYKARGALNVHLKREHDVGTAKVPKPASKKHVCHLCSKAFVTGPKLEKHIRSHTGERPFSCDICKKKFTDGWYLKVHLRGKHGQDGVSDNCDSNLDNNLM